MNDYVCVSQGRYQSCLLLTSYIYPRYLVIPEANCKKVSSADSRMTRGQFMPRQAQSTITTPALFRSKFLLSTWNKHSPKASNVVMLCQISTLSDIILKTTLDGDLERQCRGLLRLGTQTQKGGVSKFD
jgi:hypothetical protein